MGFVILAGRLLKVLVILTLLVGAVKQSSNFQGDLTLTSGFAWVAENWLAIAIAWLLWNSISSRRMLKELDETSGYQRTFIGTVLRYLQVHPQVPGQGDLSQGYWASIRSHALPRWWAWLFVGPVLPDPRFEAKPMRGTSLYDVREASILSDLRETASRASRPPLTET